MSVSGLGSGFAPLNRTTPVTVPPALSSAPPTLTGWRFFAFASAFSCDRAVTAAARMIIVNNRYFCMVLAHLKKAFIPHPSICLLLVRRRGLGAAGDFVGRHDLPHRALFALERVPDAVLAGGV